MTQGSSKGSGEKKEMTIGIRSKECLHLRGIVVMVAVTGDIKAAKFSDFWEQSKGYFEDGKHN
jgi:hypothetical protein